MGLQHSYTLLAPIYDLAVKGLTAQARQKSLQYLKLNAQQPILLSGIGSGLDIPNLPQEQSAIGIDLTRAMLNQSRRYQSNNIQLCQGDVMALPFPDNSFPSVVMHLILAVVPDPAKALSEAARVVQPGGQILILDKFLPNGRKAWLRKMVSPVIGRIATRTDVVFEPLLEQHPELSLIRNEGILLNGWFRSIELRREY